MSDRVAFIGGSTSGRDHFPFPVAALMGGSIYPISMPLSAIALMFYRIKKWRVHGNLTSDFGSDTFDWIATIGDDISNDIGSQASTITREAELVAPPAYMDSGDNLDSEDGSIYEVAMFTSNLSTSARFSSGNFYPAFFARVFSSAGIAFILDSRGSMPHPTATSVVAKVIIGGTDYTFTLYKDGTISGDASGTFTIEPSEYWPYALRDTSPVWDTSDGSQLNDPLADYDTDDTEETITGSPDGFTPSTLVINRDPSPWSAV